MWKYKVDICALQEIGWPGKGNVVNKNYIILYSVQKKTNMNLEQDFILNDVL